MNVLILVLNKIEKLDDILEEFHRVGVSGATVLDSQGMGAALAIADYPLIGGLLRSAVNRQRPFNKVIFTVTEDEIKLDKAIKAVEDILGDMTVPGVGLMFTVPVGRIIGMTDPSKAQ